MEEENVNDFNQSPIPTMGTPSFSQNILPGLFGGFQAIGEGMANKYEKEEKEKKLEEDKLIKRNAAWNEQLYTMPLAYEKDMQQFKLKSDEYNKWISDKKNAGRDLDNLTTDEALEKKRMEYELAQMAATTKANKDFIEDVQAKYGEDISTGALKYNEKTYKDFMTRFENAKTMEERAAIRNNEVPLEEDYDLADLVDETIGEIGQSVKDTGRREETFRDPKAHANQVKEYITKSQRGKKMFETLSNPGESQDDFIKRVVEAGQVKYPRITRVQPAPVSSSSQSKPQEGYGTGNWNNKLSIVVTDEASPEYFASGLNTLAVSRMGTNDDLPPIAGLVDDNGVAMAGFQPLNFYWSKNNEIDPSNPKRVSVYGYEYDSEGNLIEQPNRENNPDKYGKWIDYTNNKSKLISQMSGFDVEKEFIKQRGGGTTAPSIDPN